MMIHTEAIVITCIDYRLQQMLDSWIHNYLGYGNYNRVAVAGSVKNWDSIQSQIELSKRVHSIQRVVLINHEDCRAYGDDDRFERHQHDLRQARERIAGLYPDLKVELFYLHLDGRFERVE